MAKDAVQLRYKLAQVLFYRSVGGRRQAQEVLREAIGLVDEHDSFEAARVLNRLGMFGIEGPDYPAALAAFDAAEARLGDRPAEQEQAVAELWLEIKLEGRAALYFFSNEPAKGAAVLAEVGPVVEARGGPIQKQYFYTALLRNQLSQARHRVDEEIIATARAASKAADEVSDYYEPVMRPPWPAAGWKLFDLARCLALHGDLDEAEERVKEALAVADRVGEPLLHLRCLSVLALCALRRHDAAAVAVLVPEASKAAEATSSSEYLAMAKAFLAWLAWREGRYAEVAPWAEEALALWAKASGWQPLHWICLWPLIAVRLGSGHVGEAVDAGRQLLEPSQQRLPDEIEPVVEAALATWDSGDRELAGAKLAQAVELGHDLHFF
jgi:tetratricopeptide (TPR) repeat protein